MEHTNIANVCSMCHFIHCILCVCVLDDYQKAMLRLLHIFRLIMILGATLYTTLPLSIRIRYVYNTLCIHMFVHKFQALDKQNESKNSKKLFFYSSMCVLTKRERERHLGEESTDEKKTWTTTKTDKYFVALAFWEQRKLDNGFV